MNREIRRRFDEIAEGYDEQRRRLIPCFDDFYGTAMSCVVCASSHPKVLDVGAGTGLFSSFVLTKYPGARLTLIDLSESMLQVARRRFSGIPDVTYITDDYLRASFEKSFDIVISALSIHHLADKDKIRLYRKCHDSLRVGGVFVNADQVKGHNAWLESLYKKDWQGKIEQSGLRRQELDAAYKRIELDRMASLTDNLKWLEDSRFADVDCVYKYYSFAVLLGRKASGDRFE